MPDSLFNAELRPLNDGRERSLSEAGVFISIKFVKSISMLVCVEPIVL
jgi:hypothetical protein